VHCTIGKHSSRGKDGTGMLDVPYRHVISVNAVYHVVNLVVSFPFLPLLLALTISMASSTHTRSTAQASGSSRRTRSSTGTLQKSVPAPAKPQRK
jgi:hypothetical protein